jgi:integrase
MAIRISWREHTAKDGTVTRYARFRTPARKENGTVGTKPVERSVGSVTRREGAKLVEEWYQRDLESASLEPQSIPTFAEVALAYQHTQGASPYFEAILLQIGLRPITDINQGLIMKVAAAVYPNCTAATINRQLFTPVKAALRMQGELGTAIASRLKRPKGHDSLPDLDVPAADWYRAVIPVANPWLRAFLLIGRLHGRRPGELLNRTVEHFNPNERTLAVYDTKGRQHIVLNLAEPAWAALMALPRLDEAKAIERPRNKAEPSYRLTKRKKSFLFGTNQKTTMRKWLVKACDLAGVRYHMPKEAGRHAFATGAVNEGKSTAWLTSAGYWKSPKIPLAKYVHLEKQNVAAEAKATGEGWFGKSIGEMPDPVRLTMKTGEVPDTKEVRNMGTGVGTKKALPSK